MKKLNNLCPLEKRGCILATLLMLASMLPKMSLASLFYGGRQQGDKYFDGFRVPFRVVGQFMFVGANVGGHFGWFLIDSGNDLNWISRKFPGFHELGKSEVPGPLGPQYPILLAHDVRLGGVMEKTTAFMAGPKSVWGQDGAVLPGNIIKISGVLGFPFLRMTKIAIDYTKDRAWVLPPGYASQHDFGFFPASEKLHTLRIHLIDFGQDSPIIQHPPSWRDLFAGLTMPYVSIRIGGRRNRALLDTGSAIIATPDSLGDNPRPKKSRANESQVQSRASWRDQKNSVRVEFGTLRNVTFGGSHFDSLIAEKRPDVDFGIIGWLNFGIFHRVVFDFNDKQILWAGKDHRKEAVSELLLGAGVIANDTGKLYRVTSNGTTIQLPGSLEELVAVNGTNVNRLLSRNQFITFKRRAPRRNDFVATLKFLINGHLLQVKFLNLDRKGWFPKPTGFKLDSLASSDPFVDGPGVYLKHAGGVQKLRPGSYFWPRTSSWKIVAVGGFPTPLPVKCGSLGLMYQVPQFASVIRAPVIWSGGKPFRPDPDDGRIFTPVGNKFVVNDWIKGKQDDGYVGLYPPSFKN